MTEITLCGGCHQSKIADQNIQRTINWYPDVDKSGGKHRVVMMPTPGLKTAFVTLAAGGSVRGMLAHRDILYAVAANTFYVISAAGVATSKGTLLTSAGSLNMAATATQIMVVDGVAGYIYTLGGDLWNTTSTNWEAASSAWNNASNIAAISDSDYVDASPVVSAQDGYFLNITPASDQFQISDLLAGTSWGALQFASAEANWDNLVNLISIKRNLYLIGQDTTEVWFNSGATIPFERNNSVFFDYGCAAQDSVAQVGDNIMFLGRNRDGLHEIVVINGFQLTTIQNRYAIYQLSRLTTISDARGFGYQQEGHLFYVLTFPTEQRTFVYDLTIGEFHERQSLNGSSQGRWRANCHAVFMGKHYVGDYNSGSIYEMDTETYTEAGTAITRTRVAPLLSVTDNNYITADRLEIDFETGVGTNTSVDLYISTDGGHTFGSALNRIISTSATNYGANTYWNRLGSSRNFTLKLTTSATDRVAVLGAFAEVSLETTPVMGVQ